MPPKPSYPPRVVATVRVAPDDRELTIRLVSMISLFGIYAVSLMFVVYVSAGPDIGVLLGALFAHALVVGARFVVRELRARTTRVSASARGIWICSRRPRFLRYRQIVQATATEGTLTLHVCERVRGPASEVVLRWSRPDVERQAMVSYIDERLRRLSRERPAPTTGKTTSQAEKRVRSAAPRRSDPSPELL